MLKGLKIATLVLLIAGLVTAAFATANGYSERCQYEVATAAELTGCNYDRQPSVTDKAILWKGPTGDRWVTTVDGKINDLKLDIGGPHKSTIELTCKPPVASTAYFRVMEEMAGRDILSLHPGIYDAWDYCVLKIPPRTT